jgi:hypothetical protein
MIYQVYGSHSIPDLGPGSPNADKGKPSDSLDAVVGPFLRREAIFAVIIWLVLLVAVYVLAPPESFERLEGAQQNAEVILLTMLLCTNGSQIMQLVIRKKVSPL